MPKFSRTTAVSVLAMSLALSQPASARVIEGPETQMFVAAQQSALATAPAPAPVPTSPPASEQAAAEPAFHDELATVAGVEMNVPAVDVVAVGFHEGSTRSVPMTPPEGHLQLPTRNRPADPTTAVDVAVGDDHTVVSPVDGVVVDVVEYMLYSDLPDVMVHVQPHGSDRVIRMLHVTDVAVEVGDEVETGQLIAQAAQLPFESQVDRFHNGPAGPHVHLEVR